jgi:hypothetical protein
MVWMTSRLTSSLVGVASGAGAVGVILALAGVHSALRTLLVLLFLVVAPTAAIAGLLRGFDGFARVLLACVSTVVLLIIVAMILLSAGLWSPIGELLVVAVITTGCLLAQRPGVRARVASWVAPRWAAWVVPRWQALLRHLPASRPAGSDTGAESGARVESGAGAESESGAGGEAGTGAKAEAEARAEVATPRPAIRDRT